MSQVSTETGTYLSNLFDPQVVADLIDTKLINKIVFAPLARIDTTLQGRDGDTVTLPYYSYIGDATEVAEGNDIAIAQLTQSTKQVRVTKMGRGVQITDEAVLSGYGDPLGESVNQIVTSIASGVENKLLNEMGQVTAHVYTTTELAANDIATALALFGEDNEGENVLICDANFYAKLLKSDWVPASQIAAEIKISGVVGMAYGCQVLVSNRVAGGNFYIVKRDALAIFMKRDTLVETDRDIINQSTVLVGSKIFAPYVMNPNKIIKIVIGEDSALTKITVTSAAGTASGDTKLTVSGYTPPTGAVYVYKVGDAAEIVTVGEEVNTGWTTWDGSADITAATGKVLTLVSRDTNKKALAAGTVTVTAHA